MATLAPSLSRLFRELDAAWPRRDRRTDGWLRFRRAGEIFSDHNPDFAGRVHAIDIDKDGISPDLVVQAIIRFPRVVNYVIWNRQIWSNWRNFRPRRYTGTSNPHTDHIHVSILHTNTARNFRGPWGIAPLPDVDLPRVRLDRAANEIAFAAGLERAGTFFSDGARDLSGAARVLDNIRQRHR